MKVLVKILFITLWLALAAATVVLMDFSTKKNKSKMCKNITCTIDYNQSQQLITGQDIIKQITEKYGNFQEKRISEIDLIGIAQLIKTNPYLVETDVTMSVEGILQISATQCKPNLRLIDNLGKQFYLSDKGRIMPVNSKYPVKTLIATSENLYTLAFGKNIYSIPDSNIEARLQIADLYNTHFVAQLISNDTILNSLVEQIHILPSGKLQLVTKAGMHLIHFGDTTFAAEKLDNLKHFYKNALTKTGWDKYSMLSLEYRHQVVCRK